MTPLSYRDLSGTTRLYVALVIVAGGATIIQSLQALWMHWNGWTWGILAVLTLVSGSATVRLPSLPATVSVSETFVFTSVLLFGSATGTITVALDALVISVWSYRKGHPVYKILFNVCAVPLALWLSAHLYFALSPYGPVYLAPRPVSLKYLLGPLALFTVAYYAINTWVITVAISLERNLSALSIWRDNFTWISLNYFGGASVAALLVSYTRDLDYTYLLVIVPLLVVLYFTFSTSMGRVEDANKHLIQLNSLYISTIETLAMAIDAKDQITHGHIRRVQTYAVGLTKALGVKDESQIRAIEAAALLHDMGKLAVPEYILNKPGPLTPAEFETMKLHASVGADILSAIDFPYPVVPIVRHHHESWNGSGYPDGLKGSEIPLGARILSVVDCFDALTSDRPYRPRLSDKDALRILLERRGGMYDPLIVDTFLAVYQDIAPRPESSPQSVPLRAITTAAGGNSTTKHAQGPLDDISASSDEMLTLYELARSLTAAMSVQDTADLIYKHLRRLIPASACVFFLYDEDSDELFAVEALGQHGPLIKGMRIPLGQRLSGWVAANRQTVRNSDPILDLGEAARSMTPRPHSCLSTPLLADSRLVGVLSVYSAQRDAYAEEHERVIEIIARQVARTLRDSWSTERSRKSALVDRMTGLPNLRHLIEFAEAELSQGRDSQPLSLIVVRCHLAHRNEHFTLREGTVGAVKRALRGTDLLFRSDADELIALLLHTERTEALHIAARIEGAVFDQISAASGITIQIGIACAPADATRVDSLIDAARGAAGRPNLNPKGPEPIH